MAADIIMPKVGDAMSEGKVVRWYKKDGDSVKKGEPLLEIETDKVNLDVEAEQDGTLGGVTAKEGDMVAVGVVLARIFAAGESVQSAPAAAPKAEAKKEEAASPAASGDQQRRALDRKDSVKHTTGEYVEAIEMKGPRRDRAAGHDSEPAQAAAEGGRRPSSPLARKMARDLGVDIGSVTGSGPHGRIVAEDIRGALDRKDAAPSSSAPAAAAAPRTARAPQLEQKTIPLTAMRRTIAKRLSESTGPIPHFYLTVDYDVTALMQLRQQVNELEGLKVSVNDFIIRGIALALRHHPNVNASWGDDAITEHGEVHVGVAVATGDGLITPVIRNADQKGVADIATEVRALAEKAKNRKLLPNEYQGATFTISNLGAWGIEEFTAIINPPNAAIIAVGAAEARAVVVNREIVIRDRMKLTMSCDHRVIDGATGAEFLKTLRQYIEQPLRLVV